MEKLKKILVVDDEENFTKLLKMNLESTGRYKVKDVNKAMDVFDIVTEFQPDLICLDIIMPDLNGIQACAVLREMSKTATIPIIIISAKYEKVTIVSAIENGADDYIVKPVEMDNLIESIEHMLSLAEKELLPCQLKYNLKQLREKGSEDGKKENPDG